MTALSKSPRSEVVPARNDSELRQLLADLPAPAVTCNAEGLITYFNKPAVEIWGRAPQLNNPADRYCGSLRLFSADGAPIAHNASWMARALRENKAYSGFEIVIERPDGSRRTALMHASPLHDEQGRVAGGVNILIDVTESRNAELARLHLAAIVDSSDDAIISKNLDGVIQSWNAAAERLFGYGARQAVGRHISFIIPAERSEEENLIIARLRAGERIYHFDTVRLRSDGQRIDVSVTISPIRDGRGRIIGASKIVRDISDRKRAEERIYSLLNRLKEADRSNNEFLATLGHELRNPLTPLCAVLDIMKRADGNPGLLSHACETMERQLTHLVRLVDDLLDVGRIGIDKMELHRERVELAPIVRQAVEVCRPLAEPARQQISVNLPSQPIFLHADPVRLVQVFGNLLTNACKYTNEGGSIRVSAELQDSDVVVRVKDNGIGIPADKLASVFEMFAQVQTEEGRSRGGLGIGLTVVKRLVELHGGSVAVASEGPDRGSEFIVRLPALVESPEAQQAQLAGRKGRPATAVRRILIVDDNIASAKSLAVLLKISGYETATAHDGLEAVAAAEKFRPGVILMDISLPRLDGHEAARRIREQPWGKDLVLVALTGWGQDEDRRNSLAAGFDEHMVKPLDYEALTKFLASV